MRLTLAALLCAAGSVLMAGPVEETFRAVPSPGEPVIYFGHTVATNGQLAAVGAPWGHSGVSAGAVSVYDMSTGQWVYRVDGDSAATDLFHVWSLALSDDFLLVGTPSASLNPFGPVGRVQVFDARTGAWVRTIKPSDDSGQIGFGYSLAVDGERVLIGAPTPTFDHPYGAAFVYDIRSGEMLGEIEPRFFPSTGSFGHIVSMRGDRAAVTAVHGSSGSHVKNAVFVFDTTDGRQVGRIEDPRSDSASFFGRALAIDRDLVAIGSPRLEGSESDGVAPGRVFLFDAEEGSFRGEFVASHPEASGYGSSIIAEDGVLLVSSSGELRLPLYRGAAAYLYEMDTLLPIAELSPAGVDSPSSVVMVSMTGGRAVVGNPFDGMDGVAYFFDLPDGRCAADFDGDREATMNDLAVFLGFYAEEQAGADLAEPIGAWNFFDIAAFVSATTAGCPLD